MPKMMLRCELSDADRLRISAAQVAEIKAREIVEVQKKSAVAGYNETLKQHRAREHDFNESLLSGSELRDVDVETRKDPLSGKEETWRLDTNERIRTADIDPDERQVLMSLPNPGATDIGAGPDATDEQRDASTPEEAEALRLERLHQERIERISAGVQEARERITVVSYENAEPGKEWKAVLQYGNRVLEAEAETAAAAADGVAHQVTDILQDEEDRAEQWALAAAASEAEQARQAAEVAALAAEQAADDTATKRRTLKVGAGEGLKNGGLKAPPKRKRVKVLDANDQPIEGASDGEPPTPGDDGPVATGEPVAEDETGLVF
jgi:hypothetical protein